VIIRILGEGQFDVDDDRIGALNELDDRLGVAVEADDAETFRSTLRDLLDTVRQSGARVPARDLVTSDLVLPDADTSLAEVRALLGDEGLIPG